MKLTHSAFEKRNFRGRSFFIKRDDLLDVDFTGNKARKFEYFLAKDFPRIDKIVSYGSNQSNAMYSLSVLAVIKGWNFIYFCDHIPLFLRKNPVGNYKYALQNGMEIFTTTDKFTDANALKNSKTLVVEEGGRQKQSEYGLKKLANELKEDISKNKIKNPYIFLPSGTGITALYLQKHLPFDVYTCSTVGDDKYLKEQWHMVEKDIEKLPKILNSQKKYHYETTAQ